MTRSNSNREDERNAASALLDLHIPRVRERRAAAAQAAAAQAAAQVAVARRAAVAREIARRARALESSSSGSSGSSNSGSSSNNDGSSNHSNGHRIGHRRQTARRARRARALESSRNGRESSSNDSGHANDDRLRVKKARYAETAAQLRRNAASAANQFRFAFHDDMYLDPRCVHIPANVMQIAHHTYTQSGNMQKTIYGVALALLFKARNRGMDFTMAARLAKNYVERHSVPDRVRIGTEQMRVKPDAHMMQYVKRLTGYAWKDLCNPDGSPVTHI